MSIWGGSETSAELRGADSNGKAFRNYARDPRAVFEQLFGAGDSAADRAARRQTDRSVIDWVAEKVARLKLNGRVIERSPLTPEARSALSDLAGYIASRDR